MKQTYITPLTISKIENVFSDELSYRTHLQNLDNARMLILQLIEENNLSDLKPMFKTLNILTESLADDFEFSEPTIILKEPIFNNIQRQI